MSNAQQRRFANDTVAHLLSVSPTDWQGEVHLADEIALGDINYSIEDSAVALLAADSEILAAANAVTVAGSHAGTLRVADYFSLIELAIQEYWGFAIEDSPAALLGVVDPEFFDFADYVAVTGNDAGSLNLVERENLAMVTSGNDWAYRIVDSADNLMEADWVASIGSASSVSILAGAAAADSLNAADNLIAQILDATAVNQINGSAAAIATAVSAEGIDTAPDVAAIVAAGAALASDLGIIIDNTYAVVDAAALTAISGAANQLGFILSFPGIYTAPDVALTVAPGPAAAADLNSMDQKTTRPIDAGMVISINGNAAEIAVALSSGGIEKSPDIAVTVNAGAVDAADLATIDSNTSARVNARAVSLIGGPTELIAAVIGSDGIAMSSEVATIPDAGAAMAAHLISIDRHAGAAVDASQITQIIGTAAELLRAVDSPGVLLPSNFDVIVTGLIDTAELATLEEANGSGAVHQATAALAPAYLEAVPAMASHVIRSGTFMNLVDCAGSQTFHVAAGGKLNLIGSDGDNLIVFDDYVAADLLVSRSGATAIFSLAADATQIAWIDTDWLYAPVQTIAFGDGSQMELTLVGNSMSLGGAAISEIGALL